jgi:hypothetical protein
MTEPVRARRLTDQEGQRLQQIVRRGSTGHVTAALPDRCFAFDQFGPLSIRPCHGTCWAKRKKPAGLPATHHRTHGVRYFRGCHSSARIHGWVSQWRRSAAVSSVARSSGKNRRAPSISTTSVAPGMVSRSQ